MWTIFKVAIEFVTAFPLYYVLAFLVCRILSPSPGMNVWESLDPWREKLMATHSRTLAWKIPWTEEPGRLQSMGSLRVGHD